MSSMWTMSSMFMAGCVVALAVQSPPDPRAEWITGRGFEFTTCEPGTGLEDLEPLARLIGDARIVALGEPTHGTREAFQMKHRLVEFLCERMGFTLFSIEANMPEAYRLNEYVLEGKGDPRELIAGMYFWTWNTEEVLALVEWMRAFNASGRGPVQFTGFDMQTPDVAAQLAQEFIDQAAPDLSQEARETFAEVPAAQRTRSGGGFGIATGSFPVEAARGKRLRYSGWIRTENLVDGYAGLWWRCDGPEGSVLAFDNMRERGPRGTTEWQRYEITLDVPEATTNINWGVIMPGQGSAWFDDLAITLDEAVPAEAPAGLDFEAEALPFFIPAVPGYTTSRIPEEGRGGGGCMYLRSNPGVDPAAARKAADALLAQLIERRDALAGVTSPAQAEWGIQNARVVAQSARLVDPASARPGLNVRDEAMADNVRWILDQNPDQKIILWAHNGHVARGRTWGTPWMGYFLERMYPDAQMVVFGFAASRGRYTAMKVGEGLRSDNELAEAPPQSLERILAEAGKPRLILDVRSSGREHPGSEWLREVRLVRSVGALATEQQFFPVTPAEQFDVIIYLEETTPSRPLR